MFLSLLIVMAMHSDYWRLVQDMMYQTEGGKIITVPKDFLTNLASVPRMLRPILNRNGKSRRPAVLHDWLYTNQVCVSRKEADKLFYEALRSEGMNWAGAQVYYRGVRAFGFFYYGKCKDELHNHN